MSLSRSTFYDRPPAPVASDELVARIGAICDEFECYGYRRVGAALRQQGVVVNSKKLRRLMREHDLQPKRRRRYVVTTDSDHAGPIFPDLAKDVVPDRPNQLWVSDLTYVAIPGGFVYLAAILDAWSRKVVGYAISRSMDARIAIAALKAAIRNRAPAKGASITPIEDRSMRLRCIASYWPPMAGGIDESPRESLRQRQGRKLHEDAEGRGSLPGSLRDVRGCHCRPSPLHRRRVQYQTSAFRTRLSQPCAIRRSTRPARGQSCGLILSTRRGALHQGGPFSKPNHSHGA